MPVTPPPRPKPSNADIEAFINKGGSPVLIMANSPQLESDPDTIKHVNVRLTDAILRRIDALRSLRPRKMGSPKLGVSMRDWIVEAVIEKLERDSMLEKE